jgi:hydroxyethylthiazole kinase-like uncharacterized protein yjeF
MHKNCAERFMPVQNEKVSGMADELTAERMRAIERAAIDGGGVTGLELMERAGRGVVDALFEEWPRLDRRRPGERRRAVVLCGPGNNGGDGFVVARLLKDRGWEVEVYLYGDPTRLPPDARTNYLRWAETGRVMGIFEFEVRREWDCDLVVDALFGTGLTRPLEDLSLILTDLADAAALHAGPGVGGAAPVVVAVDLPSGLDTDTGRVLVPAHGGQGAAAANLTVTFHRRKRGHVLGEGPALCGHVVVKDIGLGPWDDPGEGAR